MSLDVMLDENGGEVYSRNITHNLVRMAKEAGIYDCLWRPDENGVTHAHQIIEPLEKGVILLATQKSRFQKLEAENGWGTWVHFLIFCTDYLQACRNHPMALVSVSR
jgi:hypothetical protein